MIDIQMTRGNSPGKLWKCGQTLLGWGMHYSKQNFQYT